MITEQDLYFSDGQAETTVTTHASTNDLDLKSAYGDAIPHALWLTINCVTAATSATSVATVQFQLVTDSSVGSFATVLLSTGAIAVTSLTKGATPLQARVPIGALRYLRVNYIIAGEALTAGSWQAQLSKSVDVLHTV